MAPVNPTVRQHGQAIETNGVNIYYESHGQGEPLVLLHGGSLTGDMWQPYLAGFTKRYRVITRTCRAMAGGVTRRDTMSYQHLADDIVAFIHALDLRKPLIARIQRWRAGCPGDWHALTRPCLDHRPGRSLVSSPARSTVHGCGMPSVTRRPPEVDTARLALKNPSGLGRVARTTLRTGRMEATLGWTPKPM